ncbi:putative glutamine synthetase [Helianthus annuus]|nr:putative glutamine synthetase [Helianthus annuus]
MVFEGKIIVISPVEELQRVERKPQVCDDAVGGSSLVDGQIELMLHRRLLFDDTKGVGEVLNETICVVDDCRGFCPFTICTGRDDRHFFWWLVMCDAYTLAGKPIPTNKRCAAGKIFSNPEVEKEVPWYRIEQEYTVDVNWPLGWPQGGFPGPQGPYYCGIGTDKAFGHDIVDAHNKACLYAGINISGINGEVMSGQWEFQVGPAVGISVGG